MDSEIDKRLDAIGTDEAQALKGKAGVANARLAYQVYEELFSTERWALLADAGALPQRPLWASTGVKDPAYPDTLYVTELVAPGVVNTMPEKTLDATFDHGVVTGDTDHPRLRRRQRHPERPRRPRHLLQRRRRGARIRRPRQVRGQLEGTAGRRRGRPRRCTEGRIVPMSTLSYDATGAARLALEQHLPALVEDKVATRIFAKDPTLWGPDAEAEASVRLGWVEAATVSQPLVADILELRDALRAEGVTRIVLCGMGGSSLAPEVIAGTAGVELTVLDSTDPEQVAAALADRLAETAIVVSSKSGSTLETDSQRRIFEHAFTEAGLDAKSRIIIVTDPGSPLDKASREAGYRAVFNADPNVGGRYSALTAFGLVPSGLAGVDIQAFLDEAEEAAEILNEDGEENIGLALGAALGGTNPLRDKIVIAEDGSGIVGFADWAEQLIAESTGKLGTGVLPVVAGPVLPGGHPRRRRRPGGPPRRRGCRRRTRRKRGRHRRRPGHPDDDVGVRHRRGRPPAGHQPVRPARRRGRQGGRPRPAGRPAGTDAGQPSPTAPSRSAAGTGSAARAPRPKPSAPCSASWARTATSASRPTSTGSPTRPSRASGTSWQPSAAVR